MSLSASRSAGGPATTGTGRSGDAALSSPPAMDWKSSPLARDRTNLALLIVEPSLTQRLWWRALLANGGCRVTAVSSSALALGRLTADLERYDVVVVASNDRGCPDSKRIAQLRALGPRVFVVDRERTPRHVGRVRDAGATDLVRRPRSEAEAEALLERIRASGVGATAADPSGPGFRGSRIPSNDRTQLYARCEEELALARALGARVHLGLIALENLPEVKIEQGRELADQILLRLESLLLDVVRPSDYVARHTGCEFAVLMPDVRGAGDAREFESVVRGLLQRIVNENPSRLPLRFGFGVASAAPARTPIVARRFIADALGSLRPFDVTRGDA